MSAGALDARLLVPDHGRVPAEEAVVDAAGEPVLVRIEGDWEVVAGLGDADRALVSSWLARAVGLTVAVDPAGTALSSSCDLFTGDAAEADSWEAGFARAPFACLAAALLVRGRGGDDDVWAGLVAESTTYSLLQAGPEFARWLGERKAPRRPSDDGPRVRVDRDGGLTEIVLTRPDRHNALDVRMRDALFAVLDPLRHQPDERVLLRGDGPSFCSGGDLDEFGTFVGPVEAHAVRLGRSLARCLAELSGRTVAALHGACIGAGIELPAFAGTVVAADDTRINLPEAGLGLIPGAGGTVSVTRRAGRHRMLDLLVSGRTIDAATALEWGLVDEVVPADRLLDRARELARQPPG